MQKKKPKIIVLWLVSRKYYQDNFPFLNIIKYRIFKLKFCVFCTGNVMIVRRYSVSSPIHSFAAKDPWKPGKGHPNSRNLGAQGTFQSLACSLIKKKDNEEKMLAEDSFTSKNRSHRALPEPVLSCRWGPMSLKLVCRYIGCDGYWDVLLDGQGHI